MMRPTTVTPCVYLLPDDFTGWATVTFAVASMASLPLEDGARLVVVPPDGHLQTSSPQELGIVSQRFYVIDAHGKRTAIDQPEAHHGADPNAAWKAHGRKVVLGFYTGFATDDEGRHVFERFYVGVGPAGDAPHWPNRSE